MTDHGDDEDDARLKSLRAVWLSMPDEDPPERGLAELMAAARVKADEMTKPSLWQRVIALLRRPPVFALATALVLIGGAVFISQRGDKMRAEQTSEGDNRARDTVATGSASSMPAGGEAEGKDQGAVGAAAAPTAPDVVAQPAPAEENKPAEPAMVPPPDPPRAPAKPTRRPSPPPKVEAKTTSRPALSSEGVKKVEEKSKLDDGDALRGAGGGGRGFEDKQSSDSFASPEATVTEAPAKVGAQSADRAPPAPAPASPAPAPSRTAQYLAQAKSAAARGDCNAARMMMKRVASDDAAAYRKALAGDAALKKCVVAQ